MKNHILVICIILLIFNATAQSPTELQLGSSINLQLNQNSPLKYVITIPSDLSQQRGNLYLHAFPLFLDPLQVPSIVITSEGSYSLNCYEAHIQFTGVCLIPERELKPTRNFNIEIKCIANCKIKLQSYFSKSIHMGLGKSIQVHAKNTFAFYSQNIVIIIPASQTFNNIVILAQITNLQQNIMQYEDAVDLYINYGESAISEPTQKQYKLQSYQFNGGGRICFISQQQLKEFKNNKVIKAYLKIKSGITVNFHASKRQGNKSSIELGSKQFGYSHKLYPQQYKLPISKNQLGQNKTIQIMLDIFSGKINIIVGFDLQYAKKIEIDGRDKSSNILITPSMRDQYSFNGFLMIKIQTQSISEYILFPTLIREDVNIIESSYTYFDELKQGQITNYLYIQKYKYLEGKENQQPQTVFKNYSLKVDFKSGEGDFYLRRCKQLQSSSNIKKLSSCILDETHLKSSSFSESLIPNQKIWNGNILTINMEYDARQCTQQRKFDKELYVTCAYQLVIVGSSKKKSDFSFEMQRKYHINYLRQNMITKEYIYKGNYAYYSFYMPNLNEVKEIDIVLTTYSGQSTIIYSTVNKLPTLETSSKDIIKQTSIKHNLIIKRQSLKQNIYLSIYAYQSTQINIGIIVRRTSQKNDIPEYPLTKNLLQYKALKKSQIILYKIVAKQKQLVTVFINDISGGALRIKLYNKDKKSIKCDDQIEKIFICSFTSEIDTYYIQIENQILAQAIFTVIFKDEDDKCITSSLNMPIFAEIGPFEAQCFSFTLNRLQSLRYSSSFTDLQKFNQISQFLQIKSVNVMSLSHNYDIISQQKLKSHCPNVLINNKLPQSCQIVLFFQNTDQNIHHFNFALSQEDIQIVLFDGLNQKIIFQDPEDDQGKHFYYQVTKADKMQVFISSPSTNFNYFVVGKFITKQQFLSKHQSKESIYLQYVDRKDRAANADKDNYFYTTVTSAGLSTIAIEGSQIQPYLASKDGQCYFVISVYIDKMSKPIYISQKPYFDLEVSQKFTYLRIGESKLGHINKDEIYSYRVDPADGIVQFNMINKAEYNNAEMCLTLFGTNSKESIMKHQTFYSNYLQTYKFQKIQSIYIHGKSDDCSYEIRYISNNNPFINIKMSHPYEMILEKGQMKKFIYFNRNLLGFKIVEMASAGAAIIYIKPIPSKEVSFKDLLTYKQSDFPIKQFINGKFHFSSLDKNYCSYCNYYIMIATQTRFVGQIVFLKTYDAIPLTSNHILKQNLVPSTQNSQSSYVFYSKRSFDVDLNIISGKIQVIIKNYLNKQLVNQLLTNSKTIRISISQEQGKPLASMYNDEAKYKMFIRSQIASTFSLQIKRENWRKRIISGYPFKLIVDEEDPVIVQFINSDLQTKQLDIMVDIDESKQLDLNFSFLIYFNNGVMMKQVVIEPIKIAKSKNTYLITLPNHKATYLMNILSEERVSVNILLIQNKVNQLLPAKNYYFNKNGIYQISSNNHRILVQAFNCQGQLTIEALGLINVYGHLDIKRPNYGGHFVFSLQLNNTYNNYYILVHSKIKDNPLSYIINYYYYNGVNPYEKIDAKDYDISYQSKQTGLVIKVNPPVLIEDNNRNEQRDQKEQQIKIKSISYHAYGSLSKDNLIKYSRCRIVNLTGKTIEVQQFQPQLQLKYEDIKSLINDDDNAMDNSSDTFYLTVEALVEIQTITNRNSEKFPSMLTLYYNTIQIPFNTKIIIEGIQAKKYWFTDSIILFVIWLVLPFLLALVSLFYLLRYCVGKLMRRQINMVQQIDIQPQVGMSLPSQTQGQTQTFAQNAMTTQQQFNKEVNPPESGAVLCKQNL